MGSPWSLSRTDPRFEHHPKLGLPAHPAPVPMLRKLISGIQIASLFGIGVLSTVGAIAAQCRLEQGGVVVQVDVPPDESSLVGRWTELDEFRVRTAMSVPSKGQPWLLIEVYANAANKDIRIISSQTVESPYRTGRVEVVEPKLGATLVYECKDDRP